MNPQQLRIIGAALAILVVFILGYRLTRAGKPYPGLLFNAHKLLALAAAALVGIHVYRAGQSAPLSAGAWAAAVVTALCVVGLFATGAVLSLAKPAPEIVRALHHLAPYLAMAAGAVTLWLL
ncbi:MAG: hypothetical protein GXY76_11245 [Chloroflexi bacterium]|nr:hypothetical protein [Chloroflexota bacterium]